MQDLFVNLSRSDGFAAAANPAGYARQTAMHLAFNWRRSRRRHPEIDILPEAVPATDESPVARLIRSEELQSVLDHLAELPDDARDLIVRRFIEGEPYDQIGRDIGKTAHQVRGLCHKAIGRLRASAGKEARYVE